MTNEPTLSALTDSKIIERIAVEVMGWEKRDIWEGKDKVKYELAKKCQQAQTVGLLRHAMKLQEDFEKIELYDQNSTLRDSSPYPLWDPVKDWNHWRMVENAIRIHQNENGEDSDLWDYFLTEFSEDIVEYWETDLKGRCNALIKALDILQSNAN